MTHDLLKEVAAAADKLEDQLDKDAGGNFDREPPAAGPCFARLVSYVEVGDQPRRAFQGNPKPDVRVAILQFELVGKKHQKEIEEGGKKRVIYPILTERITLARGERSNSFKLAASMAYGRQGIKNMAQFLGETFRLEIIHNEVEKDGRKTTYANIRDSSGWKVSAPINVNADGDEVPVKAPDTGTALRLLLWDAPSKAQWDSIFIDGTRTVTRDGKKVEISRNWLQDLCVAATDFAGSALETILVAAGGGLPSTKGPESAQDEAGGADSADTDPMDPIDDLSSDKAPAASADEDEFDPLAGLDL